MSEQEYGLEVERTGATATGIDPSLVITPPKIVGGYRVTPNVENGLVFMTFTKKPSWWHRMWCRLLLGWSWVD